MGSTYHTLCIAAALSVAGSSVSTISTVHLLTSCQGLELDILSLPSFSALAPTVWLLNSGGNQRKYMYHHPFTPGQAYLSTTFVAKDIGKNFRPTSSGAQHEALKDATKFISKNASYMHHSLLWRGRECSE